MTKSTNARARKRLLSEATVVSASREAAGESANLHGASKMIGVARQTLPVIGGDVDIPGENSDASQQNASDESAGVKAVEKSAPIRTRRGFGLDAYYRRGQLRTSGEDILENERRYRTATTLEQLCCGANDTSVGSSSWGQTPRVKSVRSSDVAIEQQDRRLRRSARARDHRRALLEGLPTSLRQVMCCFLDDTSLSGPAALERFRIALDCSELLLLAPRQSVVKRSHGSETLANGAQ